MNAPARSALPPGAPTKIGRFELRRPLGSGAQATVWLGFDPRLERDVSIKWMNQAAQASSAYDWRREARTVSRLAHPHIVPVFEADLHEGRPFLVFEYVVGDTLADRLRRDGAMAPRAAVNMMLGILEGLQAAHAAGVVHRDLKPSNVLVDADGRARVMDFGIAGLIHEAGGSDGMIVGSPGYISPEAARGEAPSPAMDVFSAGVLLIEMLTGERLLREPDVKRALQRVINDDLQLPPQLSAAVDDVLRAVLRRAIARDAAQRLPTANALHAALSQWINPSAAGSQAGGGSGSSNGTLDFLLRRMRYRTDFPAMSESIARIQRIADTDDQSLGTLAAEVSRDVALTNKLLRLVNTAQYSHAGGGSIGTVLRAVALVGFASIRNMALSLVLLEGMQDKDHANQLKEEYLRALMAGVLANELAPTGRDGEEAFVAAMFQNLGRLLTEYYLPEEARQIRDLSHPPAGRPAVGETQASISVLGLSFDELGHGVSRHWGLPESLQRCMNRPTGEPPAHTSGIERLRWLTLAANEVATALLETEPSRSRARIQVIGERYAKAIGLTAKDVLAAVDRSRQRLQQTTRALDIVVPGASPAHRLLAQPAEAAQADAAADTTIVAPQISAASPPTTTFATHEPTESAQQLASGIQRITDAMASDGFRLNEVLRMILETMHVALGFRAVVFCLRDAKADALTGRFTIGERVDAMRAAFHVPLRAAPGKDPDLFTHLCSKGLDSVIADATTATISARLPLWFREQVAAPSFVLLPLMVKGAPFGLIYADKAEPGAVRFTPQELALLGTLRNQAVMAFRQAGG